MDGNTHGGNDTLTATDFNNNSSAYLYGDASDMSGTSQGGNDILTTTYSGSYSSSSFSAMPMSCPAVPTVGMTPSRPPNSGYDFPRSSLGRCPGDER